MPEQFLPDRMEFRKKAVPRAFPEGYELYASGCERLLSPPPKEAEEVPAGRQTSSCWLPGQSMTFARIFGCKCLQYSMNRYIGSDAG